MCCQHSCPKSERNVSHERRQVMDDNDLDNSIEEEWIFTELLLVTIAQAIIIYYVETNFSSSPMRTSSLSGAAYVFELLDCGNDRHIKEVLRMSKNSFDGLISWADEKQLLLPSRNISVEEQVAMFLSTLGQGLSNLAVQERFQHSGETVSRYAIY